MRSTTATNTPVSNLESKSEPTEAEKKELLEQAILRRQKLAEGELEMAQVFLQKGKLEIAQRRFQKIMDEFEGSAEAVEAKTMLKKLRLSSQ